MEQSKRPALLLLAQAFAHARVPYAVIGGVALQVHRSDSRATLDVALAVHTRADVPAALLEAAGFRKTGTFLHSENWAGPEGTPVQITDDPALAEPVARAMTVDLDGVPLRVLGKLDLLREKLRAGSDPARRRSKRLQDLADAQGLLEDAPELGEALTDAERRVLDSPIVP